ncbi:MAG: hypothetical protein N3D77_15000 [Geminicoccaceae bacterium]|nr:hypothetical protein [Geminicoccaceae bacterium]
MARGQGAAGHHGAEAARRLTLLVHDRLQAEAALAVEAELGLSILLAASAELVRFVGPGYLVALGRLVGRPIALDCGAEPGTALAALRAGARVLVLHPAAPRRDAVEQIARRLGAELRPSLPAPVLALAPGEDAAAVLRARLDGGAGPSSPRPRLV